MQGRPASPVLLSRVSSFFHQQLHYLYVPFARSEVQRCGPLRSRLTRRPIHICTRSHPCIHICACLDELARDVCVSLASGEVQRPQQRGGRGRRGDMTLQEEGHTGRAASGHRFHQRSRGLRAPTGSVHISAPVQQYGQTLSSPAGGCHVRRGPMIWSTVLARLSACPKQGLHTSASTSPTCRSQQWSQRMRLALCTRTRKHPTPSC
mmetsp:Transcript_34990/g.48519  ORF Transcript_34990/g.48519 Transcript_34990/m.48519 type:complete len:207 (-) Transcript_34990:6-626(-)